jgi:hypothetical protein
MRPESIHLSAAAGLWTDRQGTAIFTRLAFKGVDLTHYWRELVSGITDDAAGAGVGMDLSIISQLMGDQPTGLAIQADSLRYQRLFRSPCAVATPKLRVLALAAEMDIGGNTPVEFLLEGSDIELIWLYIVPGTSIPDPLPDHDVAIVVVPDDSRTRTTLIELDALAARWPRPILNLPRHIGELDRHRLCRLLKPVPGLEIPQTAKVSRQWLLELSATPSKLTEELEDGTFPVIVRPIGSHAGLGLAKIDFADGIREYLNGRSEEMFFISRFVDYSSDDGLFRKYRLVLVDGNAYACHMAIAEQWKIWYLNADMVLNPANRAEEAHFMAVFDEEFGMRHAVALSEMANRIGVEYCTIDCAETKDGRLLIFEADNTAIVHDMDDASTFPYKPPQMRKIFDAFVAMLYRHARKERRRAA